jgi:single-stranded DNA-binding protein
MLMPSNENTVRFTGNISNLDIKNGAHGPFGSFNIAIDDSYTKPGKNGQQPEFVEKTHFIPCVVSDGFFKKVPNPEKGARISIEGKVIVEHWKDKQSGAERSAIKVKVIRVKAYISPSERNQAKQMGWYGKANAPQGGYNNNAPQGGFNNNSPQGGYNNNAPQGAFNNNAPQGGFNNNAPQGGYN